jgi:recombination protein RecR
MSSVIPKPLAELIEQLGQLPGVGPRSAERYAQHLLKAGPNQSAKLSGAIAVLHSQISYCPKTFALIEAGQKLSPLYSDSRRDKKIVAVVADPFDIVALENTNGYKGTYHVLGGLLSPIDGVGPEKLRVKELVHRVDADKVKEIILAISASVEGESTALLISQQLGNRKIKITRLARGLPVGVDLEYADQLTLARALAERQSV